MLRQKLSLAAILAVLSAAALAAPVTKAAADECRTKPGASAAPGKHWFYRLNRPDHQHCWYLGSARADQSSHLGRAIPIVHRPLIRHRATVRPDGDEQTTSTFPGSEEVTVQQSLPRMNFGSRWANWISQDLHAHEVAAISYHEDHPATDAGQVQFVGPADHANSVGPQYAFGKIAFGFLLLAGALTITLPALAAALLKLVCEPSASDSNRFTTPSQPRDYRQIRRAGSREAVSDRLLARTQTGRSARRSSTALDPRDDFKIGLHELMGALHRASTGPYTLRSFAPAARNRPSRRS